ncbi:Uncharacterized protein dnl_25080 [Desulfonema limicola]|uniref:Uncharacterized protein n=1 Tax=Desulfonema limicola TaxID=45656 RepID=A0A975B7H5_9BACT|nr:Uncharacterized protein dnl_25080 [Desulfonema limicola]
MLFGYSKTESLINRLMAFIKSSAHLTLLIPIFRTPVKTGFRCRKEPVVGIHEML